MKKENDNFDDDILNKNDGKQYFLFISGGDVYAMDALLVTEIVEYQNITKVPMMQSCIKGVTNVRGNIITVVDLLDRFELGKTELTPRTSLAIVKKKHHDKILDIAIVIDEVYEVDYIPDGSLQLSPDFGTKINKSFIKSIGRYNDKDIAILNTENILNISDLAKS